MQPDYWSYAGSCHALYHCFGLLYHGLDHDTQSQNQNQNEHCQKKKAEDYFLSPSLDAIKVMELKSKIDC